MEGKGVISYEGTIDRGAEESSTFIFKWKRSEPV